MKLDSGNKHLLRLILKGKNKEGWAKVSDILWPIVSKLPTQLVEFNADGNQKFVRLTHDGEVVLEWC